MRISNQTFLSALLAAAVSATVVAGGPAIAADYTMKFGTATPRGDQNTWMERFKTAVEKRSGGRIAVKLFPSSQLGTIPRQLEGLQLGTVEAWIGPASFLKGIEPRYQMVDVPGLFKSWEHAFRTVTHPDFRDYYLNLGAKKGVIGMGIYVSNPVAVLSRKKAIHRIADYKGQKIRVLASDIEVEALRRLGAAAVPMPLLEVLPALQRGALDGVKSGMVVFVPFKYWNVTKNLTLSYEAMIVSVAFVSKLWLDRLPKDLQQMVMEEGRKLDRPMNEYAVKQFELFSKIWKKNGGEMYKFPPKEQAKLMSTLATVGDAVVAKNPILKETYDKLKAAAAAAAR